MTRLDRKPAERAAIWGMVIHLIIGVVTAYIFVKSQSATAWVMWEVIGIGFWAWVAGLIHVRQMRLAEEEQEEWERLQAERAAGGAAGKLFEEDELQAFSARNRLRIFEKYINPGFALFIFLQLAAVVAHAALTMLPARLNVVSGSDALKQAALTAAVTLGLFLYSMYASGMSREREWRPLRAAAGYMMFCTLIGVGTVIALILSRWNVSQGDDFIGWTMIGLTAVIGVEVLANFVLDFYRPRVEGVEARPAYDSRLLGLVAQPQGLLSTVAATLDYQFGFRVSQTWFYRFIEQAIAPLAVFWIITLYMVSCLTTVAPWEVGLVERMGVYRKQIGPGLHLKLPMPFETVHCVPSQREHSFYLGHLGESAGGPLLWTNKHYEMEYEVPVAEQVAQVEGAPAAKDVAPVNLLVASTSVRYNITDPAKWNYNCAKPEELLKSLCSREMGRFLASVDFNQIMGEQRMVAAEILRERMNGAAASVPEAVSGVGAGLGVEVVAVGMEGFHPPVNGELPERFHEVLQKMQDRETMVFMSQAAGAQMEGAARGQAAALQLQARGKYATSVFGAQAESARVKAIAAVNPPVLREIFMMREYMSALTELSNKTRKLIVAVQDVDRANIRLNLREEIKPELGMVDISQPGEHVRTGTSATQRDLRQRP